MSSASKKQNKPPSQEPIDLDFVNPQYPIDSTAERALVASLLDSPHQLTDVWPQVGSVDVFGNEAYRIIVQTILSLYNENKPVKLSSIIQSLNRSGEIKMLVERGVNLIDLQKEAYRSDSIETAIYLRGLWVKRQAVDASNQIRSAVVANETVDQIADKVSQFHEAITGGLSIGQEKTSSDFVAEALKRLDQAMNNPGKLTGVDTGLGKLNKHLGGWQDSDIIMIAGRPGMGKSIMGVFHAYAAAKSGVPVAFLSLEMSARSLINRLISMLTSIPYSDIVKGYINQEQAQKIHVAAGEIERLPIHWYDEAERDIADLSYLLMNWKKKHGIGLVIIDYVQLTEDRTVRGTDETEINTSVSKKYKKLQRRLKIPVIELAQLNRAVEGRTSRRGRQSDLRSTGQYEQDASLIMILYREDYYAEEDAIEQSKQSGQYVEPSRNHKLEDNIVKNRDGYTGLVKLHCDVAVCQVHDHEPMSKPASSQFPNANLKNWHEPKEESPF